MKKTTPLPIYNPDDKPDPSQMIFEVLKARAPKPGSNQLIEFDLHRAIGLDDHTHVVHAAQEQIADQAKRIAELETANDKLENENLRLKRTETHRDLDHARGVISRLVAENDRLSKALADALLRGDQFAGEVSDAESVIYDLRKEVARLASIEATVKFQRQTLAERMSTVVIRYRSSESKEPIIYQAENIRSADLVVTVDLDTGDAKVIKTRQGYPTTETTIEGLKREIDERGKASEYWINALRGEVEQRDSEIKSWVAIAKGLQGEYRKMRDAKDAAIRKVTVLTLKRVLDRISHEMGKFDLMNHNETQRSQIDLMRFQHERQRLEIEGLRNEIEAKDTIAVARIDQVNEHIAQIRMLEAQRDSASGRVKVQGRELITLRARVEELLEANIAIGNHAAALRKEAEWNEMRWATAARSDAEWRAAAQECQAKYESLVARSGQFVVGDLVEITVAEETNSPPVGYRGKITEVDKGDSLQPIYIEWNRNGWFGFWPKAGNFKLVELV